MPKYEFKCLDCESLVEVETSMKDILETPDCSNCELPMTRVYGSVGAIFRGSGFYINDKKNKTRR